MRCLPIPISSMFGQESHFMTDYYSGSLDWDTIYRAFHDPASVAENITSLLGNIDGPVVFCGFPEVAAELSRSFEIVHVDNSPAVIANSKARYPGVARIVLSEISEFLRSSNAKHVVISGRLSAFWKTLDNLRTIADAILAFPRESVLIDFFDESQVFPGQIVNFSSPQGRGAWECLDVEPSTTQEPMITAVTLKIDYSLGATKASFVAKRSYFDSLSLKRWKEKAFSEYETSLLEGLVPNDPSFSIKMVPRS